MDYNPGERILRLKILCNFRYKQRLVVAEKNKHSWFSCRWQQNPSVGLPGPGEETGCYGDIHIKAHHTVERFRGSYMQLELFFANGTNFSFQPCRAFWSDKDSYAGGYRYTFISFTVIQTDVLCIMPEQETLSISKIITVTLNVNKNSK